MRVLSQNRGWPERLDATLSASGGLRFNVLHQGRYPSLSLLLVQALPARERIEGKDLPGGVLEAMGVLPVPAPSSNTCYRMALSLELLLDRGAQLPTLW